MDSISKLDRNSFRILLTFGKNLSIYTYTCFNSSPTLYNVSLKLFTNIAMLFDFNTRQYSVGFEVVAVSITGDPGPHGFQRKSSGDYR